MLIELLPPVAVRVIYAVLIAVNVAAFAMYGVDKKRAIADEWRIPEATLLTLAACCGARRLLRCRRRALRHVHVPPQDPQAEVRLRCPGHAGRADRAVLLAVYIRNRGEKGMKKEKLVHEEFACYRDGLKIRGSMFRPNGNGPFPTIVISHELIINRLTTLRYAIGFARMGYAAFCFDFNGGGPISQSEGKTTDMTVLTEAADIKAVIDYAGKQPYTDMDRFHLMGCSLGGFASALVAAELGADFVKKLILFYPALSVPDDSRSGEALFARFDPNNIPERFFCGPIILGRQYMLDVRDMEPFSIISRYHGPVLICFGTKDHIVDYSYGVRAYEAYKAADEAAVASGELDEMPLVWLDTIQNGEHLFPFPPHKKAALNTVKKFMDYDATK